MFFSRYQLIKLLRWPVNGQSYDRIDQALNRWIGVTLYYQNAWRDRETNQWVDEKFHILERIKIYSQENERSRPKPDPGQGSFEFASSFFVWNDAVYRSFTSGNIKSLDYDFVLELESSISRRLYRFLDKRFYKARNLSFELKNLAYEHIGLSRNSPVADLKRKLLTAIDELVGKKFLKPLPKDQRFRKERAGVWHVHFEKSDFVPVAANKAPAETKTAPPGSETDLSETTAVIQKLVDAGVRLKPLWSWPENIQPPTSRAKSNSRNTSPKLKAKRFPTIHLAFSSRPSARIFRCRAASSLLSRSRPKRRPRKRGRKSFSSRKPSGRNERKPQSVSDGEPSTSSGLRFRKRTVLPLRLKPFPRLTACIRTFCPRVAAWPRRPDKISWMTMRWSAFRKDDR